MTCCLAGLLICIDHTSHMSDEVLDDAVYFDITFTSLQEQFCCMKKQYDFNMTHLSQRKTHSPPQYHKDTPER